MKKPKKGVCVYCETFTVVSQEHVFPRNLYPKSKSESRVQRMTLPACISCNGEWSDDEAHFRNVLALAGEITPIVRELWDDGVLRGFKEIDGTRRVEDIFSLLKPIVLAGKPRSMIYPASDPRVLRIIRKIVRGLLYTHKLPSANESDIFADIHRFEIPTEFDELFQYEHRDPDIIKYKYARLDTNPILSFWVITFFNRTTFIAAVLQAEYGAETEITSPKT